MEDKLTRKLLDKHCGRHEFESENSHSENGTAVFNHKSDKTSTEHTSGVAISNFRNLVNVYRTAEKNGFIVDRKPPQDDQENSDTECESYNESQDHKRRVVLKEADSSESDSCVLSESVNQTCRSYLYERNPLLDPRFTRLIEQLVPVRNGIQVEKKFTTVRKEHISDKSGEICFKDICLNETCRLVFKIMNKGNNDHRKK